MFGAAAGVVDGVLPGLTSGTEVSGEAAQRPLGRDGDTGAGEQVPAFKAVPGRGVLDAVAVPLVLADRGLGPDGQGERAGLPGR